MKRSSNKQQVEKSMLHAAGRSGTSTLELPEGTWERISHRAYELWRERGCRDGYALQDWLDAEVTVMEEIHEARE